MADNGTSFAIDVAAKADSATTAAEKLERLTQKLAGANAAADAASAAMKAGDAAYRQAEAAYDRSAKALERIQVAMQSASGPALERLQTKQVAAAAAVDAAKAALDQETVALDALRASAAAANAEVDSTTAAQKAAKDAIAAQAKSQAEAAEFTEKAGSALGALGGPLGAAGQKALSLQGAWQKLGKVMGGAGAYVVAAAGVAAIAAALVAVGVAAVKAAIDLGKWAVGLADVARTNTLLAAGMVQSMEGGEQLSAVIDDMTRKFPATREEISAMAAELAKTGLRGDALNVALEETAVKAAKAKFGPEWQLQMLSLEQQQKRLKLGISGLFSGLKLEKALEGVTTLVDLFDEGMSSGKAIKVVFESIFQPLIDGATAMIPRIRTAFLQFEILALKAMIAVKPWASTLLKAAAVVAALAAVVVGSLVVALGVVIGLVVAFAAALALPFAVLGALIAGVVYLGNAIAELGGQIRVALANFSLVEFGKFLVDGLAKGITDSAAAVVNAITGVATGAITAAKKALGIASPSKVFAQIGVHTAEGMEQGVDRGSAGVESAMTELVAPPAVPSLGGAPAPAQAPAAGGGAPHVTIYLTAPSTAAQDIVDTLTPALQSILEGVVIQIGAGPAPAGAT